MHKLNTVLPEAMLVKRINRFVAEVILNNEKLNVYVPNTGRLSELALPGARVLLSPITSKFSYKILYILKESFPVMIDSAYSNTLFHELIKSSRVPGLEHSRLIKREAVYKNHRFDFLLSDNARDFYVEIKSCTLFHKSTASFPDAVSTRASEHVKNLAETETGRLIFLVLHNDMKCFVPNYHTDFKFYETLKKYRDLIEILAYKIRYDEDLKIQELISIPVVIPEVKPRGIFFLVLYNQCEFICSGKKIDQGYYVYSSQDDEDVFRKISAIKRKHGLRLILPEELCTSMKIISDIPVITDAVTMNEISDQMIIAGGSDFNITDRGSYSMNNNIVYFKKNPLEESWFWDMILDLRFGIYF